MASPDHSFQAADSLRAILHGRRTAALIADAELIRDAPECHDRDDEAHRAIREAMLLFTLRKITRAERDCILDILSFAAITEIPPEPDGRGIPNFVSPNPYGPVA